MVGIIGAMTIEIDGLKEIMTEKVSEEFAGMTYTKGKLMGKDTVVTVCGEGKVNAAIATQIMILKYNPDFVINTGVAGGLADGLSVCDIVVADSVVQHDLDMTPVGIELGATAGIECVYMECDKKIKELLIDSVMDCGIKYQTGVIATGDQFISSDTKKQWLVKTFNAYACEMEGGAIGQVCIRNKVPFVILRAISDGGDDSAKLSFPEFAALASANSIKVMKNFISKLQ